MHDTSYPDSGRTSELPSRQAPTRGLGAVFGGWALGALALSVAGVISPALPRPILPLLIWLPPVLFVFAFVRSAGVREAVRVLDLRIAILWHVCRIPFGVAFIVLEAQGAIDPTFAKIAGPGDILAGLGALVAMLLVPTTTKRRRLIVLAWNTLAFLDILLVFLTAQRILFFGGGFAALAPFTRVPYSLLPTLVVPMILITHFVVFAKLAMREKVEAE
jgi:hypothetical protein